jgi:hypothetical protein
VNDPGLMGSRQGLGRLHRDRERLIKRQPLFHPFAQRLAVDELGCNIVRSFVLADLVYRKDIRMI